MKKNIIAVFDLDGTLTIGRSVESSFFTYLLKHNRLRLRNLAGFFAFYATHALKDPVLAVKKNKMYLNGVGTETTDRWIRDFVKDNHGALFNARHMDLVKKHGSLGHITILVTGSPKVLVERCLDNTRFDHIYASELETADSAYTGRIDGEFYYGKAKKDLIINVSRSLGADLDLSYCYADSHADIGMMSLFGNSIAVNPDIRLRRAALKYDWAVIE